MDIKNEICSAIEAEKAKKITEYDEAIGHITNGNDIAKICLILAETFHNTMEQGDLCIKLLKDNFTNDFFKNAKTKNGVNSIIFYNDDYEVSISKCLSRDILISDKNIGHFPYKKAKEWNRENDEFIDLLRIFLNKKTLRNFKNVADFYFKNNSIANPTFSNYMNFHYRCNESMLSQYVRYRQRYEAALKEDEMERLQFISDMEKLKSFIKSLTDLNCFELNNWSIRINNSYNVRIDLDKYDLWKVNN